MRKTEQFFDILPDILFNFLIYLLSSNICGIIINWKIDKMLI